MSKQNMNGEINSDFLKPPFIFPNCAIIEYNSKSKSYEIIKRKEDTEDIFRTFEFKNI